MVGTKLKISVIVILQYISLGNFFSFQMNDYYMFLVAMHHDSVLERRRWEVGINIDIRK